MTKIYPETKTYGQLSSEYFNLVKPKVFPEELAFYQKILRGTKGHILDGMCGSGRILLPLFQNGFNIEGLEFSQHMLERCRKQAEEIGLAPVLYEQSIDEMSLSKKYDVIMIIGGSFQLIYPRDRAIKALQAARDHLVKGGRLFIDTFIPWEFLYEHGKEEHFTNSIETADGGLVTLTSHSLANKYQQSFTSQNTYQKSMAGKVLLTETEAMPVLWYYHNEIILVLESLGFSKVIAYDNKLGQHPELTVYEAVI